MNEHQNILWSKRFTTFFIVNLLMSLGAQFLFATLPLYATESLSIDQSKAGYILGAYSLAALIIRPFSGYAYDYIGRKRVYIVALALFTLISALYPFASTFALLILFRFIHGLSFGFTSTGGGTIVADILPHSRRGEGVGYFGLAHTFSMALGPALGLWIMGDDKYIELFIISGIIVGISFVLANTIKFPEHIAPSKPPTLNSFIEKRVISISLPMLLSSITTGGVMTYVIIFSKEIGIANGGLYFLVNAIGIALTRLFSGRIMDKYGPKYIVTLGLIIQGIGFIALSLNNSLAIFLTAAFLIGFGNGMVMPACQTMVINVVEPTCRGVANSTFYACMDIGIGGGSIVLGWLTSMITLRFLFFISGLFLIVPLVLFLVYVFNDYENKLRLLNKKIEHQQQLPADTAFDCI